MVCVVGTYTLLKLIICRTPKSILIVSRSSSYFIQDNKLIIKFWVINLCYKNLGYKLMDKRVKENLHIFWHLARSNLLVVLIDDTS